jgi:hypothetical protein
MTPTVAEPGAVAKRLGSEQFGLDQFDRDHKAEHQHGGDDRYP